jgi:hypothetical protein
MKTCIPIIRFVKNSRRNVYDVIHIFRKYILLNRGKFVSIFSVQRENLFSTFVFCHIRSGLALDVIPSRLNVVVEEASHFIIQETRTQSNPIIMLSTNKMALFDDMFSEVFILIPQAPETK